MRRVFYILTTSVYSLLFVILTNGCGHPLVCLQEYEGEVDYKRSTLLTIDSSTHSESGCLYYVHTIIELDESFVGKALMFVQDDKFILRGIDPIQTEDFVLFDLASKLQRSQIIKVKYNGKENSVKSLLERKIITNENLEIFVFKIYNSISYEERAFDVVFFVTREHGVIGSFITTEERTDNGSKVMISPGGYILKDHIDYSNYEMRKLL